MKHHVGDAECPVVPRDMVPRDERSRLFDGARHHVRPTEFPAGLGDVVPRDERSSL